MPTIRDRIPDTVQTIMPWIIATAACLVASVILSSFIDTLHLSMQRGEAMREALAAQDATRSGTTTTQVADARGGQPSTKP